MRAIVLLSGGQDSATCLAWAKTIYRDVYTLSFDYGQRHLRELECSEKLSTLAKVKEHKVLHVPALKELAGSALVGQGDICHCHSVNTDLPASFVPMRNYIFLGFAAAWAYKIEAMVIITGVCQTDYSGYPDCRNAAVQAIQEAVHICLDNRSIKIYAPLMTLTKAQTVILMNNLGCVDWYKYTHTCYEGGEKPCQVCPACKLRAKGFQESGYVDPLIGDCNE